MHVYWDFVFAVVDHVREAGRTDVASHRKAAVARGTETVAAVGVTRIIVADDTARRVARAAGAKAATRVARGAATEAGPAVVTAAMIARKPGMVPIARKTTAKRPSPRDRTPRGTTRLNGRAAPRLPAMDPEIVHGVHLPRMPAVVVAADHRLRITEVGCGRLKLAVAAEE